MYAMTFHVAFLSVTHHRCKYVLCENRSFIQCLALMHLAVFFWKCISTVLVMHILSYILRTAAIKQLPLPLWRCFKLSSLNFVHHCNHAQVSLKYQSSNTYGPFQIQFAFFLQAVVGCEHLFDTDLAHHKFTILEHDIITGFAIGWPDNCLGLCAMVMPRPGKKVWPQHKCWL